MILTVIFYRYLDRRANHEFNKLIDELRNLGFPPGEFELDGQKERGSSNFENFFDRVRNAAKLPQEIINLFSSYKRYFNLISSLTLVDALIFCVLLWYWKTH